MSTNATGQKWKRTGTMSNLKQKSFWYVRVFSEINTSINKATKPPIKNGCLHNKLKFINHVLNFIYEYKVIFSYEAERKLLKSK